jgi:hypothetical protein
MTVADGKETGGYGVDLECSPPEIVGQIVSQSSLED